MIIFKSDKRLVWTICTSETGWRFTNEVKQLRRVATRYDKLDTSFLAFIKLAFVPVKFRSIVNRTWELTNHQPKQFANHDLFKMLPRIARLPQGLPPLASTGSG